MPLFGSKHSKEVTDKYSLKEVLGRYDEEGLVPEVERESGSIPV